MDYKYSNIYKNINNELLSIFNYGIMDIYYFYVFCDAIILQKLGIIEVLANNALGFIS